ncbi:MFS general substrate transporter [Punctularia strigosozonata HHB-11173 SS5]|uniref:MFS general substrate transporter n=1 Tax=Punctularia strigosozonata (strain HHB-11173) TaxID=741275 RepID=R7S2N3_PUNST|nr:MFS general substrate transporter [Punctularia strigosozonata HHB-11173 SS5]EIN04047.1 MFS general substrate transporter [Punctularia strigosozonata HHB-11173 SS5]
MSRRDTRRDKQGRHDERTTLLPHDDVDAPPTENKQTPLPKVQIATLMLVQLAEPMTSQCIYPFIYELVGTLDIIKGDKRKVGYYAGMIQTLFFATQALTVLQWSRLSDRIGRKPVLLIGLSGLCLSMVFFGLSTTFWLLVVSRCLNGALNGNTGVMKSMVCELTDPSNAAQAFALLPLTWAVGVTVGPFIGGTLSRPHDAWPKTFGGRFWRKYPYFLPCAVSAGFSAFVFILTLFVLKETLPRHKKASDTSPESPTRGDPSDGVDESKPPPLKSVLTRPVLVSLANYALLALLDIALLALQPLFYASPVPHGGLGLSPRAIGLVMGAYGLGNGIVQASLLPRVIRKLGMRRTFVSGIAAFLPIFAGMPAMNALARRSGGMAAGVWAALVVELGLCVVRDMCYGVIYVYITSAAPSKRCLGAVNGLAQTTASVVRAVGPAASTSLFAFSVEHDVLGGYAAYAILDAFAIGALCVAVKLPEDRWDCDRLGAEGDREDRM